MVFGQAQGFEGLRQAEGGDMWQECPLSHDNLLALQQRFPELKPVSLEGHDVTMGLGDRLGLVSGAPSRRSPAPACSRCWPSSPSGS